MRFDCHMTTAAHTPPRVTDKRPPIWIAGVVVLGALVALTVGVVARVFQTDSYSGYFQLWWSDPIHLKIWLACSAVAALLAAFPGARLLAPGAGLAAAAGILYAAGDVGTKAAVHGGVRLAFVPALLACHGLAFVSLQLGFQRGGPLATAGVATLLTNSLPIVAGFAVFAESLPGGPLGFLRVLAFVLVVLGAAALGTRGAPVADAVPAQAPAAPPRDAREREVVRGRSAPVG